MNQSYLTKIKILMKIYLKFFKDCSYFTPNELKISLEEIPNENKTFSIINFNIKSMKKNFEELDFEFSVISLTETWCHDDPRNERLFKLNNYTSIH